MAKINKGDKILTLINVFTVAAQDQERLARLLIEATVQTIRHLPGFISASIHRSLDRTRVVNYAQWRSREDFDSMRCDPAAARHMQAARALASFDPIACEVADSFAS